MSDITCCPNCDEPIEWEQNAYDLRDNDDHRYSWVAYCEACNRDLTLIPTLGHEDIFGSVV